MAQASVGAERVASIYQFVVRQSEIGRAAKIGECRRRRFARVVEAEAAADER